MTERKPIPNFPYKPGLVLVMNATELRTVLLLKTNLLFLCCFTIFSTELMFHAYNLRTMTANRIRF